MDRTAREKTGKGRDKEGDQDMKQVRFKSASLGTQNIFYVLSSSVDSLLCEGLYAPGSNDPGGPGGPGGPGLPGRPS